MAAVIVLGLGGAIGHLVQRPAPEGPAASLLSTVLAEGKLVVVTRNSPTTYFVGREGEMGFEFELISSFADTLGVELELQTRGTVQELLEAVESGEAHLAAAGLTKTRERRQRFTFGPVYKTVTQQLVCNRYGELPRELEELPDYSIDVVAGSSYEENLRRLKAGRLPELSWTADDGVSTEELLERVARLEVDCTVADSNIVALSRRYHPQLKVPFDMSKPEQLAWVFPDDGQLLAGRAHAYFNSLKRERRLVELNEKYYGYVRKFDFVDMARFRRRIDERLTRYVPLFKEAGAKYDVPWTLLAAQAYQESHWNPRAKSPTGVRGLMMLTRVTAKEVGVTNRLDPRQSIMGGAKYFAQMVSRVPEDVHDDDRYWYALAAYNVGKGHMWDARALARRKGLNPGKWSDLREVLPLLSKRKYYRTLKYGYARGSEPVSYVQRIRDYYNILENRFEVAQLGPSISEPQADDPANDPANDPSADNSDEGTPAGDESGDVSGEDAEDLDEEAPDTPEVAPNPNEEKPRKTL